MIEPRQLRDPITVGVGEACRLSGLGKTTVFKLISDGALRTVKVRGRTLVRYESLKNLLEPEVGARVGAGERENANQ
jgi:excisionase family DNA binding protein